MKKDMRQNRATIPMIITGLVMILLFFGLVMLLVAQSEHVQTHDEAVKEQRLKNLADLNGENEKILSRYHWVDKAKGIVGIPIDRAMNLVLTELQANRPHPAGPITVPVPSPAASPPVAAGAGATPAAGGQPQNQVQQAPANGGQGATPAGASPAPAAPSNQPGASPVPQSGGVKP
jgi:hypothetical protein